MGWGKATQKIERNEEYIKRETDSNTNKRPEDTYYHYFFFLTLKNTEGMIELDNYPFVTLTIKIDVGEGSFLKLQGEKFLENELWFVFF